MFGLLSRIARLPDAGRGHRNAGTSARGVLVRFAHSKRSAAAFAPAKAFAVGGGCDLLQFARPSVMTTLVNIEKVE